MDEILSEAKERMGKTCDKYRDDLSTLRTGRASAAILNGLQCDYYGDKIEVTAIASVKIPEPRTLLVSPYDGGDVKAIVAAINASDIGINPVVNGKDILLTIPALTEERRKDLCKKAKSYGEESKVAIRNIRRDTLDFIKEDDSYTEDTRKHEEEEVQKLTDSFVKNIEEIYKQKETEIMSI